VTGSCDPVGSPGPLDTLLAGMCPRSLEEVSGTADGTRVDRKYVVTPEVAATLAASLGHGLAVLEIEGRRSFSYSSVYFDTDDHALHHAAATRRRQRFKVRTRSYDTGLVMLEVKTKDGRGRTVKHRRTHTAGRPDELTGSDLAFIESVVGRGASVGALVPALTTTYVRSTVIDDRHDWRATFDRSLVCTSQAGRSVSLEATIVETKSASAPSGLDRALWRNGLRPTRISKYGTALAVLHPHLSSNIWHRTIERHFAPAP
jgi:hypothetical protein